jgi:ribosomal protein S18 acetylase RimI-like enzyme
MAGDDVRLDEEKFDSEIFGVRIGRLSAFPASATVLSRVIREAEADGFGQIVTGRIAAGDLARAQALAEAGFRLADVSVAFDHGLTGVAGNLEPTIRPVTVADLPALTDIAGRVFRGSRYYADPFYSKESADELHRRWITNCVAGRAKVVLAEVIDGRPIGFITCGVAADRSGSIDLVGVHPDHQGRGAGKRVVRAGLLWFSANADRVRVRTQATNYPAARLYEGLGFRLASSDLTFSLVLARGSP